MEYIQVVTAPAIVLSSIMVEAYKKYILVSLLVHGKVIIIFLSVIFKANDDNKCE